MDLNNVIILAQSMYKGITSRSEYRLFGCLYPQGKALQGAVSCCGFVWQQYLFAAEFGGFLMG